MHASVCAPATTSRPTPRPDNTVSNVVSSKEFAVVLLNDRFAVVQRQLRNDLPVVAPLRQLLVGMLDPDDGDLFPARLLDEVGDVGDHCVAIVSALDDAVLYVDDEQCRVRAVLECGHGRPSLMFEPLGPPTVDTH